MIDYLFLAYCALSYLVVGLLIRFNIPPFNDPPYDPPAILIFIVSPIFFGFYLVFWAYYLPYRFITGRSE